jgi:glycosyltransferase involved in cell wall biosynthesis
VKAAEAYGLFPKDVRIVYNPVDPRLFYNLHPLVNSLLDKYSILEAEFFQVYPVSSTRMVDGKGLYTLIDIFAALKSLNHTVSLVVCNAHANAQKEKDTIAEVLAYANEKGLNSNEIIFTSLEGKEYEAGVPREVVSQLFQFSNLFIFPTISENCSLILLEAMLSKVLLVLNESVAQLREFGKENALYFKFGGLGESVNYNNRNQYMEEVSKIIISEFYTNRALKASNDIKKNFNYQSIFEKMILPLLHEK